MLKWIYSILALFLNLTVYSQLVGTYTIGHSSSADFQTFSEVSNALTAEQIIGPVIFNIEPGTYYEHLVVKDILGASPINRIIFQSSTGNKNDVIIRNDPSSSGSNYTIKFDGARYVTFKNVTVTSDSLSSNSNPNFGTAIQIRNGCYDVRIENNNIIGKNNGSFTTSNAVIFSDIGLPDNFVIIRNNNIVNGSYGVYMQGSSILPEYGNMIINNKIENFNTGAIFCSNQQNINIYQNTIQSDKANPNSSAGIVCNATGHTLIRKNFLRIKNLSSLIGISTLNCQGPAEWNSQISNNIIIHTEGNQSTGIHINNCHNLQVFYNSVRFLANQGGYLLSIDGVDSSFIQIANNNFVCETGCRSIKLSEQAFLNEVIYQCTHNNFYSTDSIFAIVGMDTLYSLNDWFLQTGFDSLSYNVLPLFQNDSTIYGLHPQLNNAGIPIRDLTDDFYSKLRHPATPDIGAVEFSYHDVEIKNLYNQINNCVGDTTKICFKLFFLGVDSIEANTFIPIKIQIDTISSFADSISISTTLHTYDSMQVCFNLPVIIDSAGIKNYSLSLNYALDEWNFNDTIYGVINTSEIPDLNFIPDTIITSMPDTIVIQIPNSFDSVRWDNGSTSYIRTGFVYGIYTLNVKENNCWASRTIYILNPLHTKSISRNNEILLYPNPANDRIALILPVDLVKIKITNALGVKVDERLLNREHNTISTSHLAEGIYWINIEFDKKIKRLKFIILR